MDGNVIFLSKFNSGLFLEVAWNDRFVNVKDLGYLLSNLRNGLGDSFIDSALDLLFEISSPFSHHETLLLSHISLFR